MAKKAEIFRHTPPQHWIRFTRHSYTYPMNLNLKHFNWCHMRIAPATITIGLSNRLSQQFERLFLFSLAILCSLCEWCVQCARVRCVCVRFSLANAAFMLFWRLHMFGSHDVTHLLLFWRHLETSCDNNRYNWLTRTNYARSLGNRIKLSLIVFVNKCLFFFLIGIAF